MLTARFDERSDIWSLGCILLAAATCNLLEVINVLRPFISPLISWYTSPPIPSSSVWLWSTKLASLIGVEAYSFSFSVVFCLYGFCACVCVCVSVLTFPCYYYINVCVCSEVLYCMCRMMMSFFHVQPSEVAANLLKIKMCRETVEKMVSLVAQVSPQALPLSLFLRWK